MKISAKVQNRQGSHAIQLKTGDTPHTLSIPPKASGLGSSINGGELLFLALATCYCNDLYREAGKRGIAVEQVEVEVDGDFGADGEPGRNIAYRVHVTAQASQAEIRDLVEQTDRLTEIQNTLRAGAPVTLVEINGTPTAG